eukprot:gene13101-14374_t
MIRSQLRTARYGYINEYFPENHCVGPPISDLERLLQHEAGLGDLIHEYHPGFRDALRKTCRSLNGRSQNGSKHKLSHLMYELYHAIFADLWELALPYMIAEASTTTKMIKLPLDEMKRYEEEAKRLYDISYKNDDNWGFDGEDMSYHGDSKSEFLLKQLEGNKHLTRDHFFGDVDYPCKISDDSIEYVKRNAYFISLVILALYITYLIGRYLVNQQIPDWNEIGYIIKQACFSMFGAVDPLFYLAGRIAFRLAMGQPILPRTMQAWRTVQREKNRTPAYSWNSRFEVYVTGPLRIAKERGIAHLSCCFNDVMQLIERFIELSRELFRRGIVEPFNDFSRRLVGSTSRRRGTNSQRTSEENANPLLSSTIPFHPHSA